MLSILCPHCRQQLTVEEQTQGTTIHCLSCGQQLAVPRVESQPPLPQAAAVVNEAQPSLVVNAPKSSIASRRRKTSLTTRLISAGLHLSISLGAVYAGYYLITHRPKRQPEPPSESAELPIQQPTVVKNSRPAARRFEPITSDRPAEIDSFEPTEPSDQPDEVVASPFVETPALAELPAIDESQTVTLIEGIDQPRVELISNSTELSLQDESITWRSAASSKPEEIASLSLVEGALKFRWQESVEPAAEVALRNSLLRLIDGEFQHIVSLRSAEVGDPLEFDLGKSKQRIVGKFAHLIPLEQVYFELLDLDSFLPCTIEGTEPTQMRVDEQSTLEYLEATGAATRLTMTKRGQVAVVELESRYALPSGDEQPMSIGQGNKKVQELTALHEETLAAELALPDLRKRLKDLERNAKAVPRSRATAFAKAQQLQQLQAQAVTVRQQIAYAERLITQKNAVVADQQALQKIASLAQQLHESKLSYRFYTLVDGHRIDLLIAR